MLRRPAILAPPFSDALKCPRRVIVCRTRAGSSRQRARYSRSSGYRGRAPTATRHRVGREFAGDGGDGISGISRSRLPPAPRTITRESNSRASTPSGRARLLGLCFYAKHGSHLRRETPPRWKFDRRMCVNCSNTRLRRSGPRYPRCAPFEYFFFFFNWPVRRPSSVSLGKMAVVA